MDVTVVIATYGDTSWLDLADRAEASVPHGIRVVRVHGDTLHDARNTGLGMVDTEWVCHLDADDELEPGYFTEIARGAADVRAPSVRYCLNQRQRRPPYVPQVAGHTHACTADCLPYGNWLVVGTVARTALLRDVGGWRDFPVYEDWDLWLRCHLAGASIEAVPAAVYRAHVRFGSRNRGPSRQVKDATHHAIYAANFPGEVAA